MADTLTPQTPTKTPTRKLFKPSSKTKTSTPVKRADSASVTPRSAKSTTFQASTRSPDQRRFAGKSPTTAQKLNSQPVESPSGPASEDIAKSTILAPLTSSYDVASNRSPRYARSDTTDGTPIGLVDNDIFTPSETVSRSTDAPRSLSRKTSETTKRAASKTGDDEDNTNRGIDNTNPEPKDQSVGEREELHKPKNNVDDSQRESEEAPTPSNLTEAIKSSSDIANFFADSGNLELSHFVKALAGESDHSPTAKEADEIFDSKEALPGALEELPTDDTLVVEPSDRTKEALGDAASEAMEAASDVSSAKAPQNVAGSGQISNGVDKQHGRADASSVSQTVEEAPRISEATQASTDDKSNPQAEEPGTSKSTENFKDDIRHSGGGTTHTPDNPRKGILKKPGNTPTNAEPKADNGPTTSPEAAEDGTQSFDNMGKPAHIERSIEIPFERPPRRQSVVHSPPTPEKPHFGNIANSLGHVKDLPSTDNLASTDGLQEVPDDPPEEVLDPSVHSPSTNVSPIPKIPKITPIGMSPPPNMSQLARGLGGKTVDDVGNVVDESGNVLGHALGDLPAMVGKKVSESGEVYGDGNELIGYVTENFTNPPSPTETPGGSWGGLQIDHDGNILDSSGNVIGRFFNKPGEKGQVPPNGGSSQQAPPNSNQNQKQEEQPPKVNAHTGGSPSDIFLDVKSTTDGIQLTIRIPTTFGQQRPDS
ncbi:hypothetical protein SLS62_001521 [Diatrype stigma]|uniref:Uncharacterized protein n=1 Tax=Diatrype stigma TaxID=117547 RepID=A0AAN9V1E7_9PEZI